MLTLFILPSGQPNADLGQTIESFKRSGILFKAVSIKDWRGINSYRDKDEWYGIFWDNEGIDSNLETALPEHLKNRPPEALILYKRLGEEKAEYRARFMRRSVWLTEDFAPISRWICYETVLDGWVKEHA